MTSDATVVGSGTYQVTAPPHLPAKRRHSTWWQPSCGLTSVPSAGNACFQSLETPVPSTGNERFLRMGTTVSLYGNERFPIWELLFPPRKRKTSPASTNKNKRFHSPPDTKKGCTHNRMHPFLISNAVAYLQQRGFSCLKKSLPLSSTRMKAGKSSTSIFQMASIPSSGYSTHSMLLMLFCARMAAGPPMEPR